MEILTGPACSGKTSALLHWYRAAILKAQCERRPGRTLWLSPTHRVCQQVTQQLWANSASVILAPQVMTFDGFADRILQFSETVTRPLPPVMQRVLVRHLIDNHVATGRLKYFGGIAQTSGFLDVVLGLISELKREEAWPEHFQAACEQRGASRSDLELGSLYAAYQEQLKTQNRYDAEGRFWSARDRLVKGFWEPFPEFELVVVDGFSDYTHTQYEILGLLAQRSARMLVSLPWEDTTLRPDLFAKPKMSIERLGKVATCQSRAAPVPGDLSGISLPAGIRHLAQQLFSNPREIVASNDGDGVEILAATGMQGEVRAIAERVKRLLVGEVAARDITVAFRPLTDYAPLVREVFSNAGIPFQCMAAEPLIRQPLIKTLLSVLQLELEDWPFERLYGLLNSGWFRPNWRDWSPRHSPRNIAGLLRKLKIPNGRTAIVAAFDAARVLAESAPEDDPQSQLAFKIAQSTNCLLRLSDLLAPLRQKLNARDWAEVLTHIARELGIAPLSEEVDGVEANEAWASFQDLLFVAAGTEEMLGQGRRPLGLSEICAELSDLLQHQTMPTPPRRAGVVEILDAAQIRGLDVPFLFLGGLTESSFPLRGGDSFLYTEADRRELNAHGLTLGHRTAQTQAEMLLFYSIVTRARQRLTLSYPVVSLDGQPLSASPYLTALRDLFTPGAIKQVRIEQLDPVPEVSDMLSLSDLRVVATSEALQRRPRWFQTLAAAQNYAHWNPAYSILAAVDMSVARFQTRGFTGFEGLITQPANLRYLQERFSPQQEFSATQLEGYATCPFRFWASDVLKVREVDAPGQFTDFGRRGDIVHEILRELHSQLEPTNEAIPESAVETFRKLLTERLGQELTGSDLLAALLRIEQRLLDEWGHEYADQWASYHETIRDSAGAFLKPALFEVSFGTPHTQDLAAESRPYLTLGSAQNETRIRGRIDRIDVGEVSGQPVFNIIDYKTGRKPSTTASQMTSGRSLQLVLYALATQRLNLVGNNSLPLQAGYWCLRETGWAPVNKPPKAGPNGLEPHADWLALVDVLDELVPRLAAGIRAGHFPVYNTDSTCMSYCPYRTVCRVTQIRPLAESLAKHWEP